MLQNKARERRIIELLHPYMYRVFLFFGKTTIYTKEYILIFSQVKFKFMMSNKRNLIDKS